MKFTFDEMNEIMSMAWKNYEKHNRKSMVCDDITQFSTSQLIDELVSRGNAMHNIPADIGFVRVVTGMSNNRDDPSNHLDDPKDLKLAAVYLGPCKVLVVRE